MRKSKILVIDDEPVIHEIVSFMSHKRRYKVISASNGEEGLVLANSENPDLILLDIAMPGIKGYDVCLKLKASRETRRIPVIMLTGEGDRDAILRAREAGADDYIVKPFTLTLLIERTDKFLGKVEPKSPSYRWWQKLMGKIKRRG